MNIRVTDILSVTGLNLKRLSLYRHSGMFQINVELSESNVYNCIEFIELWDIWKKTCWEKYIFLTTEFLFQIMVYTKADGMLVKGC